MLCVIVLSVVMLNVIKLSDVMLSTIMLSVTIKRFLMLLVVLLLVFMLSLAILQCFNGEHRYAQCLHVRTSSLGVKCHKINLQMQQTPNPLAQEPDEVPPLAVHSDLKYKIWIFQSLLIIRNDPQNEEHISLFNQHKYATFLSRATLNQAGPLFIFCIYFHLYFI